MNDNEAFQKLVDIIDHLLAPGGCPWDREQTMQSIRSSVVEEACELKEAIEFDDNDHICEELGDVFWNAVFLSKLAEKEDRFSMKKVLEEITAKLIRRHPHVFGEIKLEDSESVKKQWEEIKKQEKGKEHRKSALDAIPSGLHVISRAQKVLKKIADADYSHSLPLSEVPLRSENELADRLLSLVLEAELKGFDFEHAVRTKLQSLETDFRIAEGQKNH